MYLMVAVEATISDQPDPDWILIQWGPWIRILIHIHNPDWIRIHNPDWIRIHNPDWIRIHNPDWIRIHNPDWIRIQDPDPGGQK
jgi:hypothetical protein